MWIRRLLRAAGRGLAAAATVFGPAVSPWPLGASDWTGCPYGRDAAGPALPRRPARRCDGCRCLPGPGHPERLVGCPPDAVERALWAQIEFGAPHGRRP